jgi:hypothetical protein
VVRHAPQMNGRVEGSVHQMLAESVTLNGGSTITGDLLLPGTPTVRLNGKPTFGGTVDKTGAAAPSNHQVTLNGNASLRTLFRRVDPIVLPTVSAPSAPQGTRNVTLNNASQSPGDWATLRNLTLNGNAGVRTVPPGAYGDFTANGNAAFVLGVAGATQPAIYHFQRLTLNGQSKFEIVGPVIVTVANGFSANGTFGASNNPSWLTLNIHSGGLTLNGSCSVHGYVVAPNGTVIINGNSRLVGGVVCDRLTVNGGGLLRVVERTGTPTNQPPVAQSRTVETSEDLALLITLLATDPDSSALTYTVATAPQHGTLAGTPPALTYTPVANYYGSDSFTFTASDGTATSNVATISINVIAENDSPVGIPPTPIVLDEDTSASVTLSATDVDSPALAFTIVTPPTHGTLTPDGHAGTLPLSAGFIYTPFANYHGSDTFTFSAADNGSPASVSAPVSVVLIVEPVNDAPVADNQSLSVNEGAVLPINLAGSDVDDEALTYTVLSEPASGNLTGVAPALSYAPPGNVNTTVTLTFTVSDGKVTSSPATITIAVRDINGAPSATPQTVTTDEDSPRTLTLAGADPDGDELAYTIVTPPTRGTLSEGTDANRTYTPTANLHGTDTFTFLVNDGRLASEPVTVTIVVNPVNDAPTAETQALSTDEDAPLPITVAGLDIDGDALTFVVHTAPLHGTLVPEAGARDMVYTPAAHFHGEDSFKFVARDTSSAESAPTSVTITVNSKNDAPVATSQSVSTDRNIPLNLTLVATDVDALPGASLAYTLVSGPAHGTLSLANGAPLTAPVSSATSLAVVYTPADDYAGDDSFVFKASDGEDASAPATVAITVNATPLAPVVVFSAPTRFEDPVNTTTLRIVGTVTNPWPFQLTINGTVVPVGAGGGFDHLQSLPNEGANTLTVVAEDVRYKKTSLTFTVYRITQAPSLSITFPETDSFVTRQPALQLAGTVGEGATQLLINSVPVADFAGGSFTHPLSLVPGNNPVVVVVKDALGNTRTLNRSIILDQTPPTITGLAPETGFVTNIPTVTVSGRVIDGQTLLINDSNVALAADGSFSKTLTLTEGAVLITLKASDAIGNSMVRTLSGQLDTIAPVVQINSPSSGVTIAANTVEIAGSVDDPAATLTLNATPLPHTAGAFSTHFPLIADETAITVHARDAAGNVGTKTITVRRDTTPPLIAFTAPANNTATKSASVRVTGTIDDLSATVTVNGRAATVRSDGRFELVDFVLVDGQNVLTAAATDVHGNVSPPVSLTITSDRTAPAVPVLTAPPAYIKTDRLVVRGSTEPGATVSIQGGLIAVSVVADPTGAFEATVLVAPNKSTNLVVRAADPLGNESDPAVHTVTSDTLAPVITLTRPTAGASFDTSTIDVVGSVADANLPSTLQVGGQTVSLLANGQFGSRLVLADGVAQTIVVTAVDLAGNQAQQTRTVTIADSSGDTAPPRIVVLTPAYDAVVPAASFTVTVLVTDESSLTGIILGGTSVTIPTDGGQVTGEVTVDANGEFTITATDSNDLTTTLTHRVQVDGAAPAAPIIQRISPDAITSESEVLLYASAQAGLRYEIVGGLLPLQAGTVGADGKFVATVQIVRNATNHLKVKVIGASGLASPEATGEVIQDSIAPTIIQTTPVASATGVALDAAIQIVFSEAIRIHALETIEVRAGVGGTRVTCTSVLSTDGKTLTLTPSAPFGQTAEVQVTLPAALSDLAQNQLGTPYVFSFQTLDSTAPATPIVNAVPARTHQTALTITGTAEPLSRILVTGTATALPATADAQGRFTLVVTLAANTTNTLQITARDAAGNTSAPHALSVVHDAQLLVLQSTQPVEAANNVALDTVITLTFNKPIDPASLTGVSLVNPAVVTTTVTANEGVVSLVPSVALETGKTYEIVIPATVADLFGNRLGVTRRIAFSTGVGNAPAVPVIYTARPVGATNLLVATLSGYSNPGTRLVITGGLSEFEYPASGVIDTTGLFTLEMPLKSDAQNTIVFRAKEALGNMSAPVTALDVRQDSIAPTITRISPLANAVDVSPQASLFVEFSESIRTESLTATIPSIRLFDPQNAVVPGSWIPSADARTATFYPNRTLAFDTRYKLMIGTSLRDVAGNALGAAYQSEFTTAAASTAAKPAAPVIDPLASLRTTAPSVTLTGSAPAGSQVRVFGGQGGTSVTANAQGRFSVTVSLVPNRSNPIALVAAVGDAVSDPALVTVVQVKHAAGIRILSPQAGREYNNRSVTIAGVIEDPDSVASVSVAGLQASIVGRYFFRQVVLDPTPGAKSLTAVATLKSGSTLEASVAFTMQIEPAGTDTRAPIPCFIFPEEGDALNGQVVEAIVTVEEGVQLTSVDIDRVVAHQFVGNIFLIHAHMPLQGANAITVKATDAAGLVGSATVNVVMDSIGFTTAPAVTPVPSLTSAPVITITGTAEPGSTIVVLNGLVPVRTVVGPDGSYSIVVPLNPNATNQLQVVATDAAGNISPVTAITIAHDDTAPSIVSTSPFAGQVGIPQNTSIEVRFSEALNPDTVTAASAVVVRSALGQTIQRNVLLSADGKTIRIVPAYKFLRNDTITVELDASISDLHGFALGRDQAFSFSTAAYQTTVSGIVIDPQLRPLANVKVGIQGTGLFQYTSSFGTFLLDNAPVGDQILYVDARPDPVTGLPPQGDARKFGYLEFVVPVRQDLDNGLGRPIFLVDTDLSTASSLEQTNGSHELTFTPAQKDLSGFSIIYDGGSARFVDGTTRGTLTATRIDSANIPDRLPSGAIPHFLVEIGPDALSFTQPARLGFPNVYELPVGGEVIVFHFKYGVHDYTELGRATVGADGRILTGPLLGESGFVGIIPASGSYDLTRSYLQGRVVDAAGNGLAGISVNAIAGTSYVVTDATGSYSIPLPEVRIELIRTFATVSTDLGSRGGESPSLVFQSELVTLNPSGVTRVPDIVVDSFFLGGSIRYIDADGTRVPVTGLAYSDEGHLVSLDDNTVRGVEIMVYRRLGTSVGHWEYDSEPYMRTTARLDRLDDQFDSSFTLSFLGSLSEVEDADAQSRTPAPGDVVKIVAFDRKTGFYGETDLKIPAAAEANGGDTPLDVLVDLELRPPLIELDMNRVFFLDGIRRRANIPHRGIAFTDDEYVEFKTIWSTPVATPLNRAELALPARLRVASIGYQTDYLFDVRGGEQHRVLELREALVPNRLSVLQRDTDVGVERVSVSRDGSFAPATLIPIEVTTASYGIAQAPTEVVEQVSKEVELHILNLSVSERDEGLDVSGRSLPGNQLNIGGVLFTADANGYFGRHIDGSLGTGGLSVQVGNSLETRFGETLAPVINALDATPPGLVPNRGAQRDVIELNGEHFSPVAEDNKVSFNGAAASVLSASATRLTVEVPELASSGDVTVTVAGKKSNGVRFEFLSVGINNGSFEDGSLRAFTVEGSGRVVERWKRVTPTDRQYMAFLDTMSDPRDGISTLTSDPFEVPEGMQTLLFDYNFVATTLLRPVHEVLEFQILTDSETIVVNELFRSVALHVHSPISGFELGSGFRTAGVLVGQWAGTGQHIRVRVVLKGRGQLPAFIPGMDRFDANPIGLDKNGGTGVLLDHFRLAAGVETTPPFLSTTELSLSSNGSSATVSAAAGTMEPGSRINVWTLMTGHLSTVDVGTDGSFSLVIPFLPAADRAHFAISYGTPAESGGGRRHSPPALREVRR